MEKRKALVIEDEQVVLDSVRKVLAAENYDVDLTLKGKTGIDMAIKNSVHPVFYRRNRRLSMSKKCWRY